MRLLVILTVALGVWTSTGPASAAAGPRDEGHRDFEGTIDCGDSVTAEILGVLLAAGNIDESEYEASCARLRDTEGSPLFAGPGPTGTDPTWKFKWDDGFKLSRSDKAFKLKFGGRIELDSGALIVNGGLRDDFDTALIDSKHGSGVEFRRARIFFSGDLYDRAFFKAQYDFAQANDDDNPDFKDVFIGLKKLGPVGSLKIGHFKEPMFLQEATSDKNLTFIERASNSVFFPGRNVGVMLDGNLAEKRFLWQVGVFRDVNDQGFAFDRWGDEMWDVAVRLSGAPIYSDDGRHVLHLGVAYIYRVQDSGGMNTRFRARPPVHLAQRFVDTESFPANNVDILNAELAFVHGPFSLQAEYTHTWIDGTTLIVANGPDMPQKDLEFQGAYALVSVFLTGEHRAYSLGKGGFGRLKPKANFHPANGDWGALEIAIRYSYLDLVNRNIDGGDMWDIAAGINWYLFPNLRWMLNYVHADVSNRVATAMPAQGASIPASIDGASNMITTRFQIDF